MPGGETFYSKLSSIYERWAGGRWVVRCVRVRRMFICMRCMLVSICMSVGIISNPIEWCEPACVCFSKAVCECSYLTVCMITA